MFGLDYSHIYTQHHWTQKIVMLSLVVLKVAIMTICSDDNIGIITETEM